MLARLARTQLGPARALWWGARGRVDVRADDVPPPCNGIDRVIVHTPTRGPGCSAGTS